MSATAVELPRLEMAPEKLGFFRWGRIAGRVLLTTDAGDWVFLDDAEFADLMTGRISGDHPRAAELATAGILREGLDLEMFSRKLGRRLLHVTRGPHLHILVLTLRCNQSCSYCHASRVAADRAGFDMSPEVAEKAVEVALQSRAPEVTFEFQGGEPLLNFDVLRHVVEYARRRGAEVGKGVVFSLVSNFTAMTEEIAEWLVANEVLICTSLDGPEELHNANRAWTGGNAWREVVRWIDWFNRRWVELGRDPRQWHVDALMTTTRESLSQPEAIVAEYRARGVPGVYVRPLNPTGFAARTWQGIGYSMDEFLDFYRRTLDHILTLNLQGTEMIEHMAAIVLRKMLTPDDAGFVDIQSPCGGGTGQIAYNYDGRVFPCDEGRMLDAVGDPMFELGRAGELDCRSVLQHPTVRAIAAASLLDALPRCAECWNKPFCGVCPLNSYMTTGDLFGQRPRSDRCRHYMTVASLLFERLAGDADGRIRDIFGRWTIQRPRTAAPQA